MIVDGMGIPKEGDHSVGVTAQWCGASGSVDNCQVTINCTLARPGEHRNADQVTWAHLRWTIVQFHRDIKQVLGADEFQGRTWRDFHHHMAVVVLTQAFVAEQRLATGTEYGGFDSFEAGARELVRVAAVQRLMDKHGFDWDTAEEVGVDMLRGFSEWG